MPKTKARGVDSKKIVYALFIDTVFQGQIPSWYDEDGYPVTYATKRKAQEEIAETQIEYWQQFMTRERSFVDATNVEDYILPVQRLKDRTIKTKDGRIFGKLT